MRLPDLRNVVVDGVPFVDLGGKAQSRYIASVLDAHNAKLAETDPAALTKAERERLDAAEARLAGAMAAHESAVQRWTDLRLRRWQGQHSQSLVDGIRRKVMGRFPGEVEISSAEQAKESAANELQQVLIGRNAERQAVDGNRWWRRHEAERAASAKGR